MRQAQFRDELGALIGAKPILLETLLTLDNSAHRTSFRRRDYIQVSALSIFVGSVLDYQDIDG